MKPIEWVLELLFPPKCVFCGKLLRGSEQDFCTNCLYAFPESRAPGKIPFADSFTAPLRYEGNVRESLLRYKFRGASYYAPAYGRLVAGMLKTCRAEVVTWIPVSRRRRFGRGYDQAKLLAEETAKRLGLPCEPMLRKKHTKRQSSMPDRAARNANISGAFTVLPKADPAGRHILLIDDICTTGATLSEACRVLKTAGAAEIDCAALASADRN